MASPGSIRAGKAAVEATLDNSQLRAKVVESETLLKGLKKQFGEESNFGGAMKVLKGAGAIAGISMLSSTLATAAKSAEDIVTQFRAGKISAGEMAEQLTKSLPILGQIYEAGRAIREIATGEEGRENAAAQKIMEESRKQDARTAEMVARAGRASQAIADATEAAVQGGLSGSALEKRKISVAAEARIAELQKDLDKSKPGSQTAKNLEEAIRLIGKTAADSARKIDEKEQFEGFKTRLGEVLEFHVRDWSMSFKQAGDNLRKQIASGEAAAKFAKIGPVNSVVQRALDLVNFGREQAAAAREAVAGRAQDLAIPSTITGTFSSDLRSLGAGTQEMKKVGNNTDALVRLVQGIGNNLPAFR